MARTPLPKNIEEQVLLLCRRRCSICYGLNHDTGIKQGQIAHLDHDSSNHDLDNLAFLCLEHHDSYDSRTSQSKGLTIQEVRSFRKELHEVIDLAWKQPVRFGTVDVDVSGEITGHYIREGKFETAEFDVERRAGGLVHISGIALWGTHMPGGPNIGELDFEAPLLDSTVLFTDKVGDEEYSIQIVFTNGRAIAKEQYIIGYFGMNVSFDGEFLKVKGVA